MFSAALTKSTSLPTLERAGSTLAIPIVCSWRCTCIKLNHNIAKDTQTPKITSPQHRTHLGNNHTFQTFYCCLQHSPTTNRLPSSTTAIASPPSPPTSKRHPNPTLITHTFIHASLRSNNKPPAHSPPLLFPPLTCCPFNNILTLPLVN